MHFICADCASIKPFSNDFVEFELLSAKLYILIWHAEFEILKIFILEPIINQTFMLCV